MSDRAILALGADIKNRFLIAKGKTVSFGPEIGSLEVSSNYNSFKRHIAASIKKIGKKADIAACDLHPGYFSTRFVFENSGLFSKNFRIVMVQHHHAHIASVLAEFNIKRPVIGVSFDGTGYGTDGKIWGGEFLLVDGSAFKRMAHFGYRKMPGADKVVSEPWRMAVSIAGRKTTPFLKKVNNEDIRLVLKMMEKNINSPLTSSAGRLFDAAAALIGICPFASYEAEGPIRLEAICRDHKTEDSYGVDISRDLKDGCYAIDTDSIFSGILKDLNKKTAAGLIAVKFHNSIADIIIKVVKMLSRSLGNNYVILSGGVFQNEFLKRRATKRLSSLGFKVFTNSATPVNDLNISLGQYYVSCCPCKN
jgi:hydrogenase maturation protein HypF